MFATSDLSHNAEPLSDIVRGNPVAKLVLGLFLLTVATRDSLGETWCQVATTGPTARYSPAMTFDSATQRALLFGGGASGGSCFDDTWEWNGASWSQVGTAGPSARAQMLMVYDTARNVVVLFGGNYNSTVNYGDTWEYNGTAWNQVATSGPSQRCCYGLAYDSMRSRTVLFGGAHVNSVFGDTWEWNGMSWTEVAATGPTARYDPTMVFDTARGVTVLFGGSTSFSGTTLYNDTWEWNGTVWTQVATSGPPGIFIPTMTYDSLRERIVLFGGQTASGLSHDTWEWDGTSWTQVATSGPTPRAFHEMTYDSVRGETLVFGGSGTSWNFTDVLQDTWKFYDPTGDCSLLCANSVQLAQDFASVSSLPSLGWSIINRSQPLGTTSWFQGNSGTFGAQSGAANSYVAANYNSTGSVGTISTWLLTPVLSLADGVSVSFFTRTVAGSQYPDRLELRLSLDGSSSDVGTTATSVGSFSTLLAQVNPTLAVGGYPTAWTQFEVNLSGIGAARPGRLAFRYFVTDGGANGANSYYIGIDSLSVSAVVDCNHNQILDSCEIAAGTVQDINHNGVPDECEGIAPIPTVSTWGLIALGLLTATAGSLVIRRSKRESPIAR